MMPGEWFGSEPWLDPEEPGEWKACPYCRAEPGSNGSFYCGECCGQGGKEMMPGDYDDQPEDCL